LDVVTDTSLSINHPDRRLGCEKLLYQLFGPQEWQDIEISQMINFVTRSRLSMHELRDLSKQIKSKNKKHSNFKPDQVATQLFSAFATQIQTQNAYENAYEIDIIP
jgi:hypothetical protein